MLSAVCKSPNYGNGYFRVSAGTTCLSSTKSRGNVRNKGKGVAPRGGDIKRAAGTMRGEERGGKNLLLKRGSTRAFREICHGWVDRTARPTTSGREDTGDTER